MPPKRRFMAQSAILCSLRQRLVLENQLQRRDHARESVILLSLPSARSRPSSNRDRRSVLETVVLCGGAQAPHRSRNTLPLSMHGPAANVSLQSEDVGRPMLASLPNILADLLEVATYVYAADRLVVRG